MVAAKSIMFLLTASFVINAQPRKLNSDNDLEQLQKLNAQFIQNYINHDTIAHNQIIHKDFVCIENDGSIENRKEYMKNWATDYPNGNFTSFSYSDEHIRFFGNIALVRSKSFYTRIKNGKKINGSSIYTDTYKKENGRWWCIQAQITPIVP
ncbi:MAG: nuclear transport factor 2 family protein [Bacteroidetes bacterium]|nr:nuclear transport factor 2 family protein [Bacteroidota bacterium]